jgi:hypothetical protein
MLMTDTPTLVVHVHDVWDGQLADELRVLLPEITITTGTPGFNRLKLGDYLIKYAPQALVVSSPIWSLDVVGLRVRSMPPGILLPTIFVFGRRWIEDNPLGEMGPGAVALFREDLTHETVLEALEGGDGARPVR